MKYKIRYDYQLKKADGTYLRILQQVIAIETGIAGEVIRSLGIHTDITHLKKEGKPTLSFIGLEGEPSYIDVQVKKLFSPTEEVFSNREKEILVHLISGKTSSEIAKLLYISKNTVDTHRRNMIKKSGGKKTGELIANAVNFGYV